MNCHELQADVVDLARGVNLNATVKARVDEHLDRCPTCAARFARERQLTAELRTVANSAPQPRRLAAVEQELLRAFAARHAAVPGRNQTSRSILATAAARGWLAAAAVLVLAVVAWRGSSSWQSTEAPRPAPTQATNQQAGLEPAAAGGGRPAETTVRTPPVDARQPIASAQARPTRRGVNRVVPASNDEVLRFVALPSAAGLPGLESGRIVRVKLPTAILPAYGLDVVPDVDTRVVEADVLVGQDGQPRAIRFVSLDSNPRRRQ